DFLRHENGERVDARTLQRRFILQLAENELFPIAERLDEADSRHLAKVADHCRHRHAVEQRIPYNNFVESLRRDRFAWQVEVRDELHDLALARSTLCLLERFDELRQCPDPAVVRDAIFTA